MKKFLKQDKFLKYLGVIFIFAIVSLLIQSAQIYVKGYVLGVDSIFHMNRIYETMMQMKTGEYNYFISLFSFQQSARIVNALYGPAMAYLLGGILLITESWVKFQLITSFFINIIGALGIYRIAKKLSLGDLIAVLSGILYMSTYFIASWNIAGSFTGVGNMLVPFVVYYGIEMLVNKQNQFSFFGLGFSMGILLQVHLFSSLLATVILLPFVCYGFFKTDKKKIFAIKLFAAIILAILLSLNVWIGMLYLFNSNYLLQTVPIDLMENAVYFLPNVGTGQANIGIVFSLLFFTQICFSALYWNSIGKINKFLTIIGSLFLLLSSQFFPWSLLSQKFSPLETFLQFPSRLIVIPTIFLILALGMNIEKSKGKNFIIVLGVLTLFSVSIAQNRVYERMESWKSENVLASPNKKAGNVSSETLRNAIKSKNTGEVLDLVRKGTSDYLPVKKKVSNSNFEQFDPYSKYWSYIIYPNHNFKKSVVNGQIVVSWTGNSVESINVPIVKYRDTIVRDGISEKKINPKLTDIGTIIVDSKKGENILKISYDTPRYIILSMVISGVVFILSSICILLQKLSKK
ncbi:hypothetical protein [Enterococcus gallinarum]|jgi:hypothetical protein|uniref:hypothetical protein n=1 Tax=Enterococcus TaxID=1350 RepID=UPI001C60CF3B|nr:hypothetical protein [Enterococcus gallinarum]MBW5473397.1 hypothetical protein [Enterococcus gallinarum]MDT2713781.1 hypothetical protein [Enterococcus gallinarum]MDT2728348.1 hypothetical protein [Enterococcus gallinarum]UJA23555.1 hypothetical protein HED61_08300 [Enterococcus gallinarum]